jgi:D-sedoheptulose 7-phosphate isomerase
LEKNKLWRNIMASDRVIVENYFSRLSETLNTLPREPVLKTIEILREARKNKKMIFLFGNGGSASNTSHIVNDLIKNCRTSGQPDFRILSLNENTATMTAYGNDYGYDTIFEGQLRSYAEAGDVVIAMSTSGNSPNVIKALEAARELKLVSIGFTGTTGGKMKELVDVCVNAQSTWAGVIEDVGIVLGHIFTVIFMENNDMVSEKMMAK